MRTKKLISLAVVAIMLGMLAPISASAHHDDGTECKESGVDGGSCGDGTRHPVPIVPTYYNPSGTATPLNEASTFQPGDADRKWPGDQGWTKIVRYFPDGSMMVIYCQAYNFPTPHVICAFLVWKLGPYGGWILVDGWEEVLFPFSNIGYIQALRNAGWYICSCVGD